MSLGVKHHLIEHLVEGTSPSQSRPLTYPDLRLLRVLILNRSWGANPPQAGQTGMGAIV